MIFGECLEKVQIDKVYISYSDWILLCLYRDDDFIYLGWFYEFNFFINVEK